MHSSRIFFYFILSFLGGVFMGSFFSIPKTVALTVALVASVLIVIFYRRGSKILNPKIMVLAFAILFFIGGILRFDSFNNYHQGLEKIAVASNQLNDPKNEHKIKLPIYGYVSEPPVAKGDKQQIVLLAKAVDAEAVMLEVNEKILITAKLFPKYKYGDKLKIVGELKLPQPFDGFDYKAYLAKDNIYTLMSYPEIFSVDFKLSWGEKLKLGIYQKIFSIKDAFENSIKKSVAEPNAAFINGILLGSRSEISPEVKNDFSRTGTTHILAISGYNITIVASILSGLFLLFMRRQRAFWFSVAGVAIFTILTGGQASVVRAAVMGILVLLAQRLGRLNDQRNAIVLAGALMVFLSPRILRFDVGFQLSFVATLGLIYVSPILEKYLSRVSEKFGLKETLTATLSAQIMVLPLLVYYFKNVSLVSLPANILLLPTIPFAMLLGFITGLAGIIVPVLGQIVGWFAWLLTWLELKIIWIFAKPSWAMVNFELNWQILVLIYAILIFAIYRLSKEENKSDANAK